MGRLRAETGAARAERAETATTNVREEPDRARTEREDLLATTGRLRGVGWGSKVCTGIRGEIGPTAPSQRAGRPRGPLESGRARLQP